MQIATDVVGLVDEWAARFFEELDYINEGENATRFAEQMRVDLPQVGNCSHPRLFSRLSMVFYLCDICLLNFTHVFTPMVLFLARWLYQRRLRNILHGGS